MPNPIHDPRYALFREMLTEARTAKKMLQSELALSLGKNQSFVSKYERGERRIDLLEFLEIADALGINVGDFIKKFRSQIARNR